MNNIINSFIWTILGIVLGIISNKLYDSVIKPKYYKLIKNIELSKNKKLYYGSKSINFIKRFYSNKLYNCVIRNTSIVIPFLVNSKWDKIDIDVISNPNILTFVNTDKCQYPIRKRLIKNKLKAGKKIFNNPSLFLHRIIYDNNNIKFEVGEYNYFQRISYIFDLENETYKCAYRFNKPKLRNRYLADVNNASNTFENTIPIGCDAVLAIRIDNEYKICIHKRSHESVNYPEGYMIVPSFGFGEISRIKNNPLLYCFLKEYSEEIFDREELDTEFRYTDPNWFFYKYEEVQDIINLIEEHKFYLHLIGCGFDAISGFFNLTLLAIIDDTDISQKIYSNCRGNWETYENHIKFVSVASNEIDEIIKTGKISPSSCYALSKAFNILHSKTNN